MQYFPAESVAARIRYRRPATVRATRLPAAQMVLLWLAVSLLWALLALAALNALP